MAAQTLVTLYYNVPRPQISVHAFSDGPFHEAFGPIPPSATHSVSFPSNLAAHFLEKCRIKALPLRIPPDSSGIREAQAAIATFLISAPWVGHDLYQPAKCLLGAYFAQNLPGGTLPQRLATSGTTDLGDPLRWEGADRRTLLLKLSSRLHGEDELGLQAQKDRVEFMEMVVLARIAEMWEQTEMAWRAFQSAMLPYIKSQENFLDRLWADVTLPWGIATREYPSGWPALNSSEWVAQFRSTSRSTAFIQSLNQVPPTPTLPLSSDALPSSSSVEPWPNPDNAPLQSTEDEVVPLLPSPGPDQHFPFGLVERKNRVQDPDG